MEQKSAIADELCDAVMEKSKINIDSHYLPKHVAIIMDGNGRWAQRMGKNRVFGHQQGTKAVRAVVEACGELEIPCLTLYAFSTENWKRPKMEIDTLMGLLVSTLGDEIAHLHENQIRLHAIGNLETLPKKVTKELTEVMEATRDHRKMTLTLALSYGSREEIKRALYLMALKVKNNVFSPDEINEALIEDFLYTKGMPEVDLLIRTSGEYRLSNFLLWQAAYAELYFTNTLWPDFDKDEFYRAVLDYQKRERRFGKISEQL